MFGSDKSVSFRAQSTWPNYSMSFSGHRASMSDTPLSNHIIGLSAVVHPETTARSMDLLGLFTSTLDPDNLISHPSASCLNRQDHQQPTRNPKPASEFTSARVVHRKHIQTVESPINQRIANYEHKH